MLNIKRSSCASGKWVRTFLLDGVLGSQYKETAWAVRGRYHSTVTDLSCMASNKRGLRFGRRTVDLIGQYDVGEQGATVELEVAVFIQDL